MGKVDFGGVSKQVCLEHVRDVKIGQYVLVHVGFALSKIDEEEAGKVFEFLERMNQLDELGVGENYSEGDSRGKGLSHPGPHPNPLPEGEGTGSERGSPASDLPAEVAS